MRVEAAVQRMELFNGDPHMLLNSQAGDCLNKNWDDK
jgi:hypothetical protein